MKNRQPSVEKPRVLRQGDVLFVRVDAVPSGKREKIARDNLGRLVLERGEVTTHAHAIAAPKVDLLDVLGRTYLVVDGTAKALTPMQHEEHGPVHFEPGTIWQRGYQVEERGASVRPVTD